MRRAHVLAISVIGLGLALGCGGSSEEEHRNAADDRNLQKLQHEQQIGRGSGQAMSGPATRRFIEGPGSGPGLSIESAPGAAPTSGGTGGSGGGGGTGGGGMTGTGGAGTGGR
jgi:hypothetical protein